MASSLEPGTSSPRPAVSRDLRAAIWSMTGGHCFYCGIRPNPFSYFSVDHVIPRSRGGSDDITNLVPCCRSCNAAKGTKLIGEWQPPRGLRTFWFETDAYVNKYAMWHLTAVEEWQLGRDGVAEEDGGE